MEIMSFFLRRCFLAMFSGMDIGVQGGLKIPRLTATMKYFVEQRKRYRSCTPVFELNDSSSPIVIIDICNIKDIALLHSRAFLREMLLPKAAISRQAKSRGRETATSFKTRANPSHLICATSQSGSSWTLMT